MSALDLREPFLLNDPSLDGLEVTPLAELDPPFRLKILNKLLFLELVELGDRGAVDSSGMNEGEYLKDRVYVG